MAAAFSAALIIAPVAFHRALFRQGRKPELVRYAHRMLTAGLGFVVPHVVESGFRWICPGKTGRRAVLALPAGPGAQARS